jgi:glyoxylase-like metal-dependent hydrolase (beta-lactamase superfamily II)
MSKGISPKLMKIFGDKHWSEWLPINAWVVEHPEGVIVVDTGDTYLTGVKGYLPKWHPYYAFAVDFAINPNEDIGPQLRKINIDPEKDVSKVILTHLHTDHAGGMHHFPNAEFLINKDEYNIASGVSGILAGYLPHRWPKWINPTLIKLPEQPFGPFSKSMNITTDGKIRLISTPGHVANHMSVVIENEGLFYFLAGDTSYTEENMLKAIPDGIGTNETKDTLKKIQEFAREHPTIYLPTHDPDAGIRMDEKIIVPLYYESKIIA